ncbi:MAG: hypothetical protein H0U74_07680 [Bradymonadaceae bacterium]|nr:hypothetical protein [Lujinxingiaceae bacterium]
MERQLVEHLISNDLISRQEMQRCILRASMQKTSVVEQLLQNGEVDETNLARSMAGYYGYTYIDSVNIDAQPYALKLISAELAEKHCVLPFKLDATNDHVSVAVYDPAIALEVIKSLQTAMGKAPEVAIAPRGRLQREIHRHYRGNNDATPAAEGAVHKGAEPLPSKDADRAEVKGRQRLATREVMVTPSPSPAPTPPPIPTPSRKQEPPSNGTVSKRSRGRDDDFGDGFGELSDSPRGRNDGAGLAFASEADDLAGALDKFDALLEDTSRSPFDSGFAPSSPQRRPASSAGHAAPARRPAGPNASGSGALGGEDAGDSGFNLMAQPAPRGEFDLFDDEGEGEEPELTLQQAVEQNMSKIKRLEREVEHQRAVLQTLADLLVEARVISKKALKERLTALRRTDSH